MIALAILGIGIGVILPGIALSLRMRREASDSARLALAAEQVLGDLVQRTKALEGAEEGEVDGCRWQIEPLAAAGGASVAGNRHGAELSEVRVTLSIPGGPQWELTTLFPRAKTVTAP